MSKCVAVLMGGWSSEREVSLKSGAAAATALKEAGYDVYAIDVQRDVAAVLKRLDPKPDVVFNALHGRWGEDGCVQGLLEILGIPYTHSGVLASALAMDKNAARQVFETAGIPVAKGRVVSREELMAAEPMARPYVVKPINEGSSVGVYIVRDGSSLDFRDHWPFGEQVLVEEFVPGRELTVGVMGDKALDIIEITSDRGFYDYDAKYAPGGSKHIIPAPIPAADYAYCQELALRAHQALGCRGVSRTDIRYDDSVPGKPRFAVLEVNTQPGMTGTSLVPDMAAYAGIAFKDLVAWMVENARCDG